MAAELSAVDLLVAAYEIWERRPGDDMRAARKEDALGAVAVELGVSSSVLMERIAAARRARPGMDARLIEETVREACAPAR